MIDANQLPLQPLGAGDLIDRAVRLYRRNFWPLIRIAAVPVIVYAAGSVMTTIAWRELMLTGSGAFLAFYILLLAGGIILSIVGLLLNMIVLGGATRNLVSHILLNEPVTARTTYRNVVSRFWALLGASVLVGLILGVAAFIVSIVWIFAFSIVMVGVGLLGMALPWVSIVVALIGTAAVTFGALWLFFLGAGRFAYVPQILLVEGKGVFASIGRSASLASGNVKRLMAMVFFSIVATYSALMILIVPLGFLAWVNGVDPLSVQGANAPIWYSISYQLLFQISQILLAPIWMLGLSLLYIDERVRHEAYDVELIASRRLGEAPRVPGAEFNPLVPALFNHQNPLNAEPLRGIRPPQRLPPGSTLGLGR